MFAAWKVEEYNRAFDGDKDVPGRVAQHKHLHVAAAGGITQVQRVKKHGGSIAQCLKLFSEPPQPMSAQPHQIYLSLGVSQPGKSLA